MRPGLAAAERDRRPRPRRRWLRHLLLAVSLVVVTLSVVGMHQLSVSHDIATGRAAPTAHGESASHPGHAHADGRGHGEPGGETAPVAAADHPTSHTTAGMVDGLGGACPDCADHQMAFGSCLLALTLLVLSWSLIPPRVRHVPPFMLPPLASTMVGPVLGRLVPPLSLTELSVRRT